MEHNNLKKLRKACALTQQQVADTLKIDRSTYTCYEIGKSYPPITTALKLSKIYNVSIEALFSEEELEKYPTNTNSGLSSIADPVVPYGNEYIPPIDFIESNLPQLKSIERYLVANFRLLTDEDQHKILKDIEALSED